MEENILDQMGIQPFSDGDPETEELDIDEAEYWPKVGAPFGSRNAAKADSEHHIRKNITLPPSVVAIIESYTADTFSGTISKLVIAGHEYLQGLEKVKEDSK